MALSLLASRLRHRLILQQPVMTADGAGGFSRTWQDVATLWAQLTPIESQTQQRERTADQRLQATTMYRVTLRYRGGVTNDMRLNFGGRLLNIRNIVNRDERKVALELLVEEGAAT